MSRVKCPNDTAGVQFRCHHGYLWELTLEDGKPAGQRRYTGRKCEICHTPKDHYGNVLQTALEGPTKAIPGRSMALSGELLAEAGLDGLTVVYPDGTKGPLMGFVVGAIGISLQEAIIESLPKGSVLKVPLPGEELSPIPSYEEAMHVLHEYLNGDHMDSAWAIAKLYSIWFRKE